MKHNLSIVKFLFLLMLFMGSRETVLAQSIPKLPVKPVQPPPAKPVSKPVQKAAPPSGAVVETKKPEPVVQTIKFISDSPGELFIDGKKMGMLESEIPLKINLPKGEYLLKAVAQESSIEAIRETLVIQNTGSETVYKVDFSKLANIRIEKAKALLDEANNAYGNKDFIKALSLFRSSAELGNAEAMINLGGLFENGQGVQKEYTLAMNWYRKAADLYNPVAFNSIAYLYQNGYGVERNYAEAMIWFRKSADKGNLIAFIAVGWLYEQGGFGVEKDFQQAMRWYLIAADQGNAEAMYKIGTLYIMGYGVSRNFQKAIEWYEKAAALGHGLSMCSIGDIFEYDYKYGSHKSSDLQQAKNWFSKACQAGFSACCERLKKL